MMQPDGCSEFEDGSGPDAYVTYTLYALRLNVCMSLDDCEMCPSGSSLIHHLIFSTLNKPCRDSFCCLQIVSSCSQLKARH